MQHAFVKKTNEASFNHNDAHILETDLNALEKKMRQLQANYNVTLEKVINNAEKLIPVTDIN